MFWTLRWVAILIGAFMLYLGACLALGQEGDAPIALLVVPFLFLVACWRLLLFRRWAAFLIALSCVLLVYTRESPDWSPLVASYTVFAAATVISTICAWRHLRSGF
jgi:hypothetical protein